jgi:hypothetical protein
MASRTVSITLLVILVLASELVAMPEALRIEHTSSAGNNGAVTDGSEWAAVVRRPSKWNTRRVLAGDKRTVPGGPDPQHH